MPPAKSFWLLPLALVILGSLALFPVLPARAQGCAQCREAVGQTPARTRQAYRRGISVLVFAAAGVCLATITIVRRYR